MKKGQLTVFIILGILILIMLGTFIYLSQTETTREIEAARPRVMEVPQRVQPVRDHVESCIQRVATDGLTRLGERGGYISDDMLKYNPVQPTEGNAVQAAGHDSPLVAYWWHMTSPNSCEGGCEFGTNTVGLYRTDGGVNIEQQLDQYVTGNLRDCVGDFEEFQKQGCTVTETGAPEVTSNVAEDDVFFTGTYPLRVTCDDQSFALDEYYVTIPLKLKQLHELAVNITNLQAQNAFLEQATILILTSYAGLDEGELPPFRDLNVGPPSRNVYWLKHEVLNTLQNLVGAYIPLIQVSGTRNYRFITAPGNVRDPDLFEVLYNRHFLLPLQGSHPAIEARFSYLDWWTPYFDLNCNGELCQADNANVFLQFLSFGLQRYEFAYDLSYPVMVELRDATAFNNEGYSFRFMLEQNLRNSQSAVVERPPIDVAQAPQEPSIFCDPAQRTSPPIQLNVRDGNTLAPVDEASVTYLCGQSVCNLGQTTDGTLVTSLPTCLGGIMRISKPDYATYATALSSTHDEPYNTTINLDPEMIFQASIRNFELYKLTKRGQWNFREGAPTSARPDQSTTIQLERLGAPQDEPYFSLIQLEGNEPASFRLIPGRYKVTINSFLERNLTIPIDRRCQRTKGFLGIGSETKCYNVPDKPMTFDESQPFPYGSTELEADFSREEIRGTSAIEFRQVVVAIDKVKENARIIEDLNQINNVNMHAKARSDLLQPVIR